MHEPPTLLVFGGSQGAHAINQAMMQCLPELMKQAPGIHIIHQTGERDYNDAQAAYQRAGASAEVFPLHQRYAGIILRGRIWCCAARERARWRKLRRPGKPAIFVPFPRAADDHQRVNAQALERAGAAVVLEETKLDDVWLVETVSTSAGRFARRLRRMSEAARSLAHPNAARDIAGMAARAGRKRKLSRGLRGYSTDFDEIV